MRPSMPLSVIACREHRTGHELDVLALARGSRPRTPGSPIAFIGGAKHRYRRPGMAELRSLEHARDLLIAAGHDASAATICLFSGTGFTDVTAGGSHGHGGADALPERAHGGQHRARLVPALCPAGGARRVLAAAE